MIEGEAVDWFVRGLFGSGDRIDILPGVSMRVWYETFETTTGMVVVVERLRLVCEWLSW